MAQKHIIVFADDIDGEIIADADIRSVKIDLAGEEFVFDLRDETVEKLRAKLTELGLEVGKKAPTLGLVAAEPDAVEPTPVKQVEPPPPVTQVPPPPTIQPPSPTAEVPPEPVVEVEPTSPEPEPEKSTKVRPPVTRIEVPPSGPTAKKLAAMEKAKTPRTPKSPKSAEDELPTAPQFTPRPPMPETITAPVHAIEPGVNIISAKREPAEQRKSNLIVSEVDPALLAAFDWSQIEDEEANFVRLRDLLRNGLPDAIPFSYHPEVLATEGMDTEIAEAALRHPDDVTIAPESFEKHYCVLRFSRGDAMTVLGMRTPRQPRIIAVYHKGLLQHDHHRVNLTGGGGSRAATGLPTTVKASVDRLRRAGAKIDWDPAILTSAVQVTYDDQDLGKISAGTVKKDQIQSDYQRVLRRMEAINLRKK